MVGWNPVRIEALAGGGSVRVGSGALDILARGLWAAFGGAVTLALLGEVGRHPHVVEEVDDTGEASEEEDVEEDTAGKN